MEFKHALLVAQRLPLDSGELQRSPRLLRQILRCEDLCRLLGGFGDVWVNGGGVLDELDDGRHPRRPLSLVVIDGFAREEAGVSDGRVDLVV